MDPTSQLSTAPENRGTRPPQTHSLELSRLDGVAVVALTALSAFLITVCEGKRDSPSFARHRDPVQPVYRSDMMETLVKRCPSIGECRGEVEIQGPRGAVICVQRVHEGLRIRIENGAVFALGSAVLEPAELQKWQWLIELAGDKRNYLEVRGFADFTESSEADLDTRILAFQRAKSVAEFLIGHPSEPNIMPERILMCSRGYYDPIIPYCIDIATERARNRRVEVIISEVLYDPDRPR